MPPTNYDDYYDLPALRRLKNPVEILAAWIIVAFFATLAGPLSILLGPPRVRDV